MSFAPFLAVIFLLWPVVALLGGQGFTPLLGIAGIAAIFFARPRQGVALYALAAIAFGVWAGVTESWSPASKGLISGSVGGGDFAIRAASVRIILTIVGALLVISATLGIARKSAPQAERMLYGALAVNGVLVVLLALLLDTALTFYYGGDSATREGGEGLQNVLRNANAFSLVMPILGAALWMKGGQYWRSASIAVWGLSLLAFVILGTQAAIFGVIYALMCLATVKYFPRTGFKWLVGYVAGYIALAPFLLGAGVRLVASLGIPLPGSFQSRVWGWDVVIDKIMERPLTGHGMQASKTWRETYAEHPEWLARLPEYWATYPVVPGHPHNMPLQIWAETGAIGAVIAAAAAGLLAWRLPSPEDMPPITRYATAGLIGAAMTLFSFAYSVWNEAFWAMIILAICGIILIYRQESAET